MSDPVAPGFESFHHGTDAQGKNAVPPRPKTWLVIVAAVVVASLAWAWGVIPLPNRSAVSISEPAPVISPAAFNFGAVNQGETIKHVFVLSNNSRKAQRIVRVETSCACTIPPTSLEGRVLEVGESCDVPIELHTGARNGESTAVASVFLNDLGPNAGESRVAVSLRMNVLPDYHVDATFIDLGVLDDKHAAKRVIRLHGDGVPNIAVTNIQVSDTTVTAGVPVIERQNPAAIAIPITVNLGPPDGNPRHDRLINEKVAITTTSRRVPTVWISVRGQSLPSHRRWSLSTRSTVQTRAHLTR